METDFQCVLVHSRLTSYQNISHTETGILVQNLMQKSEEVRQMILEPNSFKITVDPEWLKQVWNHEKMIETEVRANEC